MIIKLINAMVNIFMSLPIKARLVVSVVLLIVLANVVYEIYSFYTYYSALDGIGRKLSEAPGFLNWLILNID